MSHLAPKHKQELNSKEQQNRNLVLSVIDLIDIGMYLPWAKTMEVGLNILYCSSYGYFAYVASVKNGSEQ